jgi:hypothetical protein
MLVLGMLDFSCSCPSVLVVGMLDFSCSCPTVLVLVLGMPVASAVPTLRAVLALVVAPVGRPESMVSACMLLRSTYASSPIFLPPAVGMALGLMMPCSPLLSAGFVTAMEPRLPSSEWEGLKGAGTLLPTVSLGMLWDACMGLEVDSVVLEGTAEVLEPGATKSVLVPVGTFVGRLLGGWDVMSSRPVGADECSECDLEVCWNVVPVRPAADGFELVSVLDVVLLPSL